MSSLLASLLMEWKEQTQALNVDRPGSKSYIHQDSFGWEG